MAFYWYQRDPELYKAEVEKMRRFFPSFKINQLPDGSGRLYWRGKVQPAGEGGMVWDLMLISKNDHPHATGGEYGGRFASFGSCRGSMRSNAGCPPFIGLLNSFLQGV